MPSNVNYRSISALDNFLYAIAGLALFVGLVLTCLSYAEVCTTACVEGHKFQIYGIKFEFFGLAFFTMALFVHLLSRFYPNLVVLSSWIIASGLGGELHFLYVQKYEIGSWCPICVSIATCVAIAATAYLIGFLRELLKAKQREEIMINIEKFVSTTAFMFVGLIAAIFGVHQVDAEEAATGTLKDSINFGNKSSHIEVYIFTDWFCPACHKIEPKLEQIAKNVGKNAKIFFIDTGVHRESLNFTPYNLSFMVHNKDKYFQLRNSLIDLSAKTKAPSEHEVEALIAPIKYEELSFSDNTTGNKLFNKLRKDYGVNKTPTVVVVNTDTKKGKKITGSDISEQNVNRAIDALK